MAEGGRGSNASHPRASEYTSLRSPSHAKQLPVFCSTEPSTHQPQRGPYECGAHISRLWEMLFGSRAVISSGVIPLHCDGATHSWTAEEFCKTPRTKRASVNQEWAVGGRRLPKVRRAPFDGIHGADPAGIARESGELRLDCWAPSAAPSCVEWEGRSWH